MGKIIRGTCLFFFKPFDKNYLDKIIRAFSQGKGDIQDMHSSPTGD
jgi:hypothetical protein